MSDVYHHTVYGNATPFGDFTFRCTPDHNSEMQIQAARRSALRAYIRKHHSKPGLSDGNVTEFARSIGMAQSQIADMLDGRKSFGEKVARKIEKLLERHGKPSVQLDADYEADELLSNPSATVGTWPFKAVTYDRFMRLPQRVKDRIELAVTQHVDHHEESVRSWERQAKREKRP
jgi:plasmid maintenance system antidote protein VapI